MKGKLELGNYEWIMMKPKKDIGGKAVLLIPKESTVTLKCLQGFNNMAIHRIDDAGVWMVLE